jgi:hypothetical protein
VPSDQATGESNEPRVALRTEGDGSPWPVLARLPRIGAAASAEQTSPSRRETILERACVVEDRISERRYAVDGPHDDGGGKRATHLDERRTRQVRVDEGLGRRGPSRPKYARDEPMTLAGRLFRLHEAVAPHMGLIGAAILILSGSALFWLAFGPARSPSNPSEPLEFDQSLSSGATSPADTAAAEEPLTGRVDAVAAPLDWKATPRVADATAAPTASDAPLDAEPQATSDNESGAESPSLSPAATAKPAFDKAATAVAGEPITPTPHTDFYPTTPYPAFSFATAPPDASTDASVAERNAPPADGSSATR